MEKPTDMLNDTEGSKSPRAHWKKPGTQNKYILDDSICIKGKLTHNDKKQSSVGLGPEVEGGMDCKGAWEI